MGKGGPELSRVARIHAGREGPYLPSLTHPFRITLVPSLRSACTAPHVTCLRCS